MQDDVKIRPTTINSKNCLQFDFPPYLNSEAASAAIEIWKLEMKKFADGGIKICLIFNCECMTGFDTEARRKWQLELKQQKNNITEVWVVCDNIYILAASKTMGVLSGFSIKVTRSLTGIV